jgi:hypothetical protein
MLMDLKDFAMHLIRRLVFQYLNLEFNLVIINMTWDLQRSLTNPEHKCTRKVVVK